MGGGKAELTGVRWTALATLYLRAVESRSKGSILGDRASAEAARRVGGDFGSWKMRLTAGDRYLVALRARRFDLWGADFLARHPDAVVVQLGCGLDPRVLRLDPPAGVLWFDVDFPEVVGLWRRIFPERAGHRTIGSSVTDPGWLREIPADRPALVIAEGLLMYLAEDEVRLLLRRLADRLPSGALMFDGVLPWVVRLSARLPEIYGEFHMSWAIRDGREVERWEPRLRYVEEAAFLSQYDLVPHGFYRVLYRVLSHLPQMRDAIRAFRFEF